MKKNMKLKYIITTLFVASALLFGNTVPVFAQNGCASSNGELNLSGYLIASNFPGKIYLDKATWEDVTSKTTNQDFQVTFNSQGFFNGKAWHEDENGQGIGFIDFGYDPAERHAKVVSAEDTNGQDDWGNWDGIINISTDKLNYNNQIGRFAGYGLSASYTGGDIENQNGKDVMVGLGILDFSNVKVSQNNNCSEFVGLFFLDGKGQNVSHKHYADCSNPQSEKLVWASKNVHSCRTADGSWQNPGARTENSGRRGEPTAPFFGKSAEGATKVFSLKCIGDDTGREVAGYAVATCGNAKPPVVSEFIKPTFKEV